jgi:hypothetical protein
MSMHEINSAAEAITAAADPDANIIFGATINPDLEGEIIITVVATGFDASYFAKRHVSAAPVSSSDGPVVGMPEFIKEDDNIKESTVSDMDMDLETKPDEDATIDVEASFKNEHPVPNIWSLDHKEAKGDKSDDHDDDSSDDNDESELEKPSFLRRIKKRISEKDEEGSDTDSKK